jgi:hypothetical protein
MQFNRQEDRRVEALRRRRPDAGTTVGADHAAVSAPEAAP